MLPRAVRQPICQSSANRGRGGRGQRTWGDPEEDRALILRRLVHSRAAAAPRVSGQRRPDQNVVGGRGQGLTYIRHDVQGLEIMGYRNSKTKRNWASDAQLERLC